MDISSHADPSALSPLRSTLSVAAAVTTGPGDSGESCAAHGCKGKGRASAPGQVAMSLRAEIEATGADLSVNIQGKLASGLAQGASRESLFLAFAVSVGVTPGDDPAPVAETPDQTAELPPVEGEDPAGEASSPLIPDASADQAAFLSQTSAEIAAQLLSGETADPVSDPLAEILDAA